MSRAWREPVSVAAFLCLVFLPFLGKAFHNDEPFFLAVARHVLQDPWHPLAFDFTWYGHVMPASQINTTPPLLFYVLASALELSGGGEFATRLTLFPLDLAAALALYLLAARFLKRPLLPTLIVIATPAYLINMPHLMPEKLAGALGFWGLYAVARGVDGKDARWFWASAALIGLAIISKYNAALFLAAATFFAWRRGISLGRLVSYCVLAAAPAACLVVFYVFFNPDLIRRFLSVAAGGQTSWWAQGPHRLRSFLSFIGGCGVVTAFWPLVGARRKPLLIALAASCALFSPAFDLAQVRWIDRLCGIAFSCGALLLFRAFALSENRRSPGWPLWSGWFAAAGLLSFFYWSIMARMILFMLPPAIFMLAESLEAVWTPKRLERFYAFALAGTLALSLPLAVVDFHYAAAQKEFSGGIASRYLAKGRRVWYSGYMGLAHYLGGAGGLGLDAARGGWDLARPGDAVVVLGVNSARLKPAHRVLSDVSTETLDEPIPLRLMSGWTGEGGFYSNLSGFLPYSISREPLEEFTVVELK